MCKCISRAYYSKDEMDKKSFLPWQFIGCALWELLLNKYSQV